MQETTTNFKMWKGVLCSKPTPQTPCLDGTESQRLKAISTDAAGADCILQGTVQLNDFTLTSMTLATSGIQSCCYLTPPTLT